MSASLHLVPPRAASDLAKFAADLSKEVAAGEIVGLAVVVLRRDRRFFVDAFGTVVGNPHESRGLVAALDDRMRELGRQLDDV